MGLSEFDVVLNTPIPSGGTVETVDPLRQSEIDFSDYDSALAKISVLESEWENIRIDTEKARRQRYVDIDIKELRARNEISPDETVIPIRSINTAIESELPPYIAYLRQPGRLVAFNNPRVPPDKIQLLEKEFTRVAKYDSWERPFHKLLDCVIAHGWGAVEIVYDVTKPGHFSIEYIRHEDFLFPKDAIDIQYCDFVIRRYHLTNDQLRFLVKNFGFNADEVSELIRQNTKNKMIDVGKLMYRNTDDGYIYVGWYSLRAKDWLKKPEKLFLGVRNRVVDFTTGEVSYEDIYETDYPFEVLTYHEGEEDRITKHKGRIWLDQYKQEAQTAVWTGFVNRLIRASNVYASPSTPLDNDNKLRELSVRLKNGVVYNRPLSFFGVEFPNPLVINVLNALDVRQQTETANIAWAVNNRQDSRKTATEMQVALQQQNLLYSVQLSLFSIFLRHVYTRCWRIVKSEALAGNIEFLPQLDQQVRDTLLSVEYTITSAGDEDFVMRQDRINKKMQLLPIMLQTGIGLDYLLSLLKDILPDEADKFEQMFNQMKQAKEQQSAQLVGELAKVIISLADEFKEKLTPEQQQSIIQIIDAAKQYVDATLQRGSATGMAK
jgi:hypothetical protein